MRLPLKISLIILFSLVGCELFTTRTPESPEDNAVNYPPATSPGILLSNFNNSFKGLSSENYFDCFLKQDAESANAFTFIPSPDAQARYGVIFNNWNANNERNFLVGLKSSIESAISPDLQWKTGNFELMTSDSAIYLGQYYLEVNLSKKSEIFSGISRFTFIRNISGLWQIKSWQDFQLTNSDSTKTWSILKSQISN